MAVAVNCFVIDASRYTVSGVAGAFHSSVALPNPLARINSPFRTTPNDSPGIRRTSSCRAMRASTRVSACAVASA